MSADLGCHYDHKEEVLTHHRVGVGGAYRLGSYLRFISSQSPADCTLQFQFLFPKANHRKTQQRNQEMPPYIALPSISGRQSRKISEEHSSLSDSLPEPLRSAPQT